MCCEMDTRLETMRAKRSGKTTCYHSVNLRDASTPHGMGPWVKTCQPDPSTPPLYAIGGVQGQGQFAFARREHPPQTILLGSKGVGSNSDPSQYPLWVTRVTELFIYVFFFSLKLCGVFLLTFSTAFVQIVRPSGGMLCSISRVSDCVPAGTPVLHLPCMLYIVLARLGYCNFSDQFQYFPHQGNNAQYDN